MVDCHIPSLIELSAYDGDFEKYQNVVYAAFCKSFQEKELSFKGFRIAHKKHPEYKGKSATFWHIISSGSDEQKRIPDLRRYERILWPSYVLEICCNTTCENLLVWENKRGTHNRVLIFCVDIDYLVVLTKKETYCIFWTAYPVEYPNRKRRLIKEYNDYMAKVAQPNG